jgi:hypothetical protein
MATNSLIVKDGNGTLSSLSTFSGSYGLIPEHAITGTVNVTASAASPVYVTGTVQIAQPVSVDVVVGDLITVTSSQANPVYVSGNVSVADTYTNSGITALYVKVTASSTDPIRISSDVDKYAYPGGTYGALITKITASDNAPVHVTSSQFTPVYVSSSEDRPVFITNSTGKRIYVTSSANEPLFVKTPPTTVVGRQKFSSGFQIDWASTASANVSGTFILADSASNRSGLIFANNTAYDLYVAIGGEGDGKVNGFLLSSTASAPVDYSFILYPSGTYSADPGFVNAKHTGFFVSSSFISVTVTVTTTV